METDYSDTDKSKAGRWALLAALLSAAIIAVLHFAVAHGSISDNAIASGISGNCLDVYHNGTTDGTPVDVAKCNGTAAQSWETTATAIQQTGSNKCIGTATGGVTLQTCSTSAGQVWLRDKQGYYNPDTGKCLSADQAGAQLKLADCSDLGSAAETWTPGSAARAPACGGDEGAKIACEAVSQWTTWQSGTPNHKALLATYTASAPQEEWCADFVSYVYKQAGFPFTNGEYAGWDENNANNIRYMGFTLHSADSGYVPKAGDVAFFDYPGGHVEIVVSGGSKPTFVYGNSAEIDPTTGNGQMKANTITQDGANGGLVYYLSPTSA